jgi:hypothetical protein
VLAAERESAFIAAGGVKMSLFVNGQWKLSFFCKVFTHFIIKATKFSQLVMVVTTFEQVSGNILASLQIAAGS